MRIRDPLVTHLMCWLPIGWSFDRDKTQMPWSLVAFAGWSLTKGCLYSVDSLQWKNGRKCMWSLIRGIVHEGFYCNCIAKPITYICNLSFSTGVFPETTENSKCFHLFKSGDKYTCTNYRYISILPQFSKIL